MPSYYSLGFEVRNLHLTRGKNEEYSKLYVFQIHDDAETDKVTHGPFEWGENMAQFREINDLRIFAETIWKQIANQQIKWILPPDATKTLVAWTQAIAPMYIFVANFDSQSGVSLENINLTDHDLVFQTTTTPKGQIAPFSGQVYKIRK